MRPSHIVLALAVIATAAPAHSVSTTASQACPELAPPQLEFDRPVYVDPNRAGGEPVIIAAEDGSLSMSAHAGTTHAYKNPEALGGVGDFAVGYYNQTLVWRSVDGGHTWSYTGTAGLHEGPHSVTSTGFSDPGFAMDDAGNLYNVEIDLANVAVYASNDDGQSWNVANPMVSAGDRPWLTGGNEDGEAFLFVRLPAQLWRTTTGGIVWEPVRTSLPVYGQIYRDPLNPDGLIGPSGPSAGSGFSMSPDDGETWVTVPGSSFSPAGKQIFAPIDVDAADGTVYMAQGNGYRGANDTDPDGYVEFNWWDRDTESWGLEQPQRLPIPAGDVLWSWLVAGEDGRVAIAWYHIFPDEPESFYIYVAQTLNAKGTMYDCDGNGVEEFVPPQWTISNASLRPIHVGAVCLGGTGCNANTDFEAGDRRLGDYFQINHDRSGRLIIASGDTMLRSLTGGPKPVANPIFIGQSDGALLLEEPLPVRPTRCLANLPICG
ncbi:MAG: hypothetical protein KY469_09255 [Actinobacteria bacterium]|nr:hypothetical protein [Actinomycetota bacterium]